MKKINKQPIDCKTYAKYMRENAVKNDRGIIQVSAELWEQIACIIEKAILPPCVFGETVWVYALSGLESGKVNNVVYDYLRDEWLISGTTKSGFPFCVKHVYYSKEHAENKGATRNK